MIIGVPTETKNHENRVGLTPSGVYELVGRGHAVRIQHGAGEGAAILDADYLAAGAEMVDEATAWASDMVVKVKEPTPAEYHYLRDDLLLFTYLHIAADRPLTEALVASGTTSIAYETVQLPDGSLPLLAPMSEVAGRMSVMVGSYHLMGAHGGRGVLLGGVPGVRPAQVTIIGAGQAGANALGQAYASGADVTILDLSIPRLRHIDEVYAGKVKTVVSNAFEIERSVLEADLVIGAVLLPGKKAPKLVSHDLVSRMKKGSVLVDIAIDQGGCFEDSHPTTHDDPTYRVENSTFYCVANMPGGFASTSTSALTNATLPYVVQIASLGWKAAVKANAALLPAVSSVGGRLTHAGTAEAFPDIAFADASGFLD